MVFKAGGNEEGRSESEGGKIRMAGNSDQVLICRSRRKTAKLNFPVDLESSLILYSSP